MSESVTSGRERIEDLLDRPLTEAEAKIHELRESGYRGWVNWDTGEAETEDQHNARIQEWVDSQVAKGLTYTKRDGWVPVDEETRER